MCVLASAVDIFILTHREAVTGYPAGHRLASFYPCLLPRNTSGCLATFSHLFPSKCILHCDVVVAV